MTRNEFQDEQGAKQCKQLTVCRPGSYVDAAARPETDRSCALCPPGSVSSEDNAAACAPCASGTYQDGRGQVACKQGSACGVGEFVAAIAQGEDDTTCGQCDGVTAYQDTPGRLLA